MPDRNGKIPLEANRLAGKSALVAGGTRGLGAALVETLAGEGCDVLTCARQLPDYGSGKAARPNITFFQTDMSLESDVRKLTTDIKGQYGVPDIVINTVGYVGGLAHAWEIAATEYNQHWTFNMMSAFWLTEMLLPDMLARNTGVLVYIGSQAGKRAVPRLAAYSASKFALAGFAQTVAKEIESSGVRSYLFCPAGMNTPMREDLFGDASQQQEPNAVADIIVNVLCGSPELPHGAEVIVKEGEIVHVERSRVF